MASATNANVQEEPGVIGFTYLKRDLVRLLGILVHQSKEAQDRARDAGGIQVVMNQCVIDERNPCELLLFSFRSGDDAFG